MSYIDSDVFLCFLPSLAVFCCISLDFHGSLFCHFFILTDRSHPLIDETCLLPCFGVIVWTQTGFRLIVKLLCPIDKLQGSVAKYLRCGGVVNSQIKTGLFLSLTVKILFRN